MTEPISEIFSIPRIYISTPEIFNISSLLCRTLPLALVSKLGAFHGSHYGWDLDLIPHSSALTYLFIFSPISLPISPQVTANLCVTFPAHCMASLNPLFQINGFIMLRPLHNNK